MYKAKILVIGPCQSGKTYISNFLSDSTEPGGDYHPTQGCRILEFEQHSIPVGDGRNANAEVELWDCSGDHKFEGCWPALAQDANGIIFVFNPEQSNHDKELDTLHSYFVEQHNLRESQCVVYAHHKEAINDRDLPAMSSTMSKIRCVHTNIDDEGEALRDEFRRFLSDLLMALTDKHEQEELGILNSR